MTMSDRTLYLHALNERNELAEALIYLTQQSMQIANGDSQEKQDEAIRRIVRAVLPAKKMLNRMVPNLCEKYMGMTDPNVFDEPYVAPSGASEIEKFLIAGLSIEATDAAAHFELPDNIPDAFAMGWNRRHAIAEAVVSGQENDATQLKPAARKSDDTEHSAIRRRQHSSESLSP